MSDLAGASDPKLSRAAVVSLGVCGLLIGFVIAPLFPFVVVAVTIWWLFDDLRRDPSARPGWLGAVAFAVFALAASFIVLVVTVLAVDESCGRELFGGATENFDQDCADAQRWRSVVAITLTLVVTGLGFFGVRRSDASQSPIVVAARSFVVMAFVVAGVTAILVVT